MFSVFVFHHPILFLIRNNFKSVPQVKCFSMAVTGELRISVSLPHPSVVEEGEGISSWVRVLQLAKANKLQL